MQNLEKLNEFRKEFMGKYYKPLTQNEWNFIIYQPGVYVLELHINQELVGIIFTHTIQNLTRNVLFIDDLIVDKNYRGMGIGKLLCQQVIKIAKDMEISCVEVLFKEGNKVKKLYESLGFTDRKNKLYRLYL